MMKLIINYFAYKGIRIYQYFEHFIEYKIQIGSVIVENKFAKAESIQIFVVVTINKRRVGRW